DGQVAVMKLEQAFVMNIASAASYIEHLIVGKEAGSSELHGERQQIHRLDNQAAGFTFNKEKVEQGINVWGEPSTQQPPVTVTPVKPTAAVKRGATAGTTAIEANLSSELHLAIKVTHQAEEHYEPGDHAPSGGTVIKPYTSGSDISGVDAEINNT